MWGKIGNIYLFDGSMGKIGNIYLFDGSMKHLDGWIIIKPKVMNWRIRKRRKPMDKTPDTCSTCMLPPTFLILACFQLAAFRFSRVTLSHYHFFFKFASFGEIF